MTIKHQEHILCIKANLLTPDASGMAEYELSANDVFIGRRAMLENDPDFRQLLPVVAFTHKGKIWAYRRTNKGGEERLHGAVAVAVGGHWDLGDLIVNESVIDIEASLHAAVTREITEEVGEGVLSQVISSYPLGKVICASDTEVDRLHLGLVTIAEISTDELESAEDSLEAIGFIDPSELLFGDYELETWARLICERLVSNS